jgi:NAD(P)-dependent dehydrogenase (short-subunit alcohol dehydrogenase family)
MFDFSGKVVLAVGGAGYLCSPALELMAKAGAAIVVTDLDEEKAANFARELETKYSARAVGVSCDVGNEDDIRRAVQAAVEQFGRLDILINAAYKGSHGQSLEEMPHDAFDHAAHVQLTGSFLLAREAAKVMEDGANMVFFSSMYGRISPEPAIYHPPMLPNPIDYGVVKAGLEQMIRYLAVHYAPRNIRVNGVVPGAFPHAVAIGFGTPEFDSFMERLAAKSPMNRVGRQNELAGPVVFLASDEASFVTGHLLVVDGGWTIW